MNIVLDDKIVEKLVPESLPMLIHGEEGSGASAYTISVAAKWFEQGYKIIFLCGYTMAEEQFTRLTNGRTANFYTKDQVEDFKTDLRPHDLDNTIIVIKNIELFGNDAYDLVSRISNLIISGDIAKSSLKDKILQRPFTTKVYFSDLEGIVIPKLNKYEGYVVSEKYQGITKLE